MLGKCIECMKYLPNKDNCSDDREQGRKELHNDKFTCDGFIANKESVKTMNRKETVIYLMDNPKGVAKNVKGCCYYVRLINGQIRCSDEKTSEVTRPFQIHVPYDDSEFEIVRELRKMSFGKAIITARENKTLLHSIVANASYDCNWTDIIFLRDEILIGLWTVEGIYENK